MAKVPAAIGKQLTIATIVKIQNWVSLGVLLSISATAMADASETDGHDIDSLVAAATAWYEGPFAESFINGTDKFWDYYGDKTFFIIDDTPRLLSKPELATFINDVVVAPWIVNGFAEARLVRTHVIALGTDAVRLRASWQMLDDKGTPVTDCALSEWNYVVVRSESSWRIVTEIQAPCES